ncbi:uncharacterized protein si:ch211-142k18.1 [Megalops cyprinoides]|uniref:uncharacterized protein si:ch211-142k18.1 n=1 Tax=Megalops cyprinoides TaxID=118141 RepID=UPI0018641AC0|nr:uncharacterized protein si:ch211-142k18.1 [Megalops cyprinoides]
MLLHWVLGIVVGVSLVTTSLSQSGDGEWGSGDPLLAPNHNFTGVPRDQPADSAPQYTPDSCSMHFHTCPTSPRWLRAQREELSYLRAIQHGNQAVMENLIQYVSAEMGEQRYQEVIQENIAGIKEDHLTCEGIVQKITENLETQLEGEALESLAEAQKIKEESLAFEDMLRTAADIAKRLESSSQALYASFTKQLKKTLVIHR